MPFRLATFNVENLLRRFDFSGFHNRMNLDRSLSLYSIGDEAQFRELESARAVAQTDDNRQLTALALTATQGDIVCLQEVDDEAALGAFEYNYLYKMIGRGYRRKLVSNGNDVRGIDVALMLRDATVDGEPIEVVEMRSHAELTFAELDLHTPELAAAGIGPKERIFRRDCFVVDLKVGRKPLTLFLVHLKSMAGRGADGREASMPLRTAEAKAVRLLVEQRFGGDVAHADWAICGDCNDYRERVLVGGGDIGNYTFQPIAEAQSALNVWLADGFAVNAVERRPVNDRWTLFHTRGPGERHLCQLDYILLSPGLAAKNADAVPDIVRSGQPWRTPFPPGQEVPRLPRAGWDRPKASDHCPVAITLSLG